MAKKVLLREVALEKALAFVGVRETSPNWGPEVSTFLHAAGVDSPAPWCCAFVNYCAEMAAREVGVTSPLESVRYQASVQSCVDYGRAHGWQVKFASEVEPGDLFCIYFPSLSRFGHIGIVTAKHRDNRHFGTCEGNSNDDGSRDGYEVVRRVRENTDNVIFLRYDKGVEGKVIEPGVVTPAPVAPEIIKG